MKVVASMLGWVVLACTWGCAAPPAIDAPSAIDTRPSIDARLAMDVRAFGARADGVADDAPAIQRALDAAGAGRGGKVELGAGRFRMDRPIAVPEGVSLVGVWEAPHHTQLDKGTVLEVYAGKGQEDGPPLITLGPSSAVRGITFFYPEQRIPGTQPYPWTIQGQGMHGSVMDCTFVNSYRAIDFATYRNELHYIRNCFGCPLKVGVRIDKCSDIGRIENVHFNPHYWGRAKLPGVPRWEDLLAYLSENLVAFEFGWTDWEYVLNTFCFGAKIGYRFHASDGRTVNGNFLGIGADWCGRAVLVEECQMPGLLITNGEFVGSPAAEAMVEIAETNTGVVQLNNCSFWGPCGVAVRAAGKGTVSLQQCNFFNHGKGGREAATIDASSRSLMVSACRFGVDRPDVRLSEGVGSAVITGNWFLGSKEIENRSTGDVQEGLNAVGGKEVRSAK